MLNTFSELVPFGWDGKFAQQFQSFAGDGRVPARVVRVDRGALLVAASDGIVLCRQVRRALLPGSAPGPPSTGDWVAVHPEPGFGMALDAILPRRSVVRRSNAMAGAQQVLAANVDIVLVVHCVDRPLRLTRLERALVMAWDGGATPVVLVNKTDLQDSAEIVGAITASLAGVDVLPVSARTGDGLDSLTERLGRGATVALIGESGTGKSSLINALLGEERLAVGRTRRGDYKGRHTTTARELVPLAGGPILIDTPGLRTMGLWDDDGGMDPSSLR